MASQFWRFARWYDQKLQTWPATTKSATAASMAMIADVTCQYLLQDSEEPRPATSGRGSDSALQPGVVDQKPSQFFGPDGRYDLNRTLRMGFFTSCMTPAVHLWYGFLVKRVDKPLKRVAMDQLVWAPPGTALFLFSMGTMKAGGDTAAGVAEAKAKTKQALLANWAVWPAVQFVNFSYIPAPYQVLFVNGVSFFWSIFLSRLANKRTVTGQETKVPVDAGTTVIIEDKPEGGPGRRSYGFPGLQLAATEGRDAADSRAHCRGSPHGSTMK